MRLTENFIENIDDPSCGDSIMEAASKKKAIRVFIEGQNEDVKGYELVCASTDNRLLLLNLSTGEITELDGSPVGDGATATDCGVDRETVEGCGQNLDGIWKIVSFVNVSDLSDVIGPIYVNPMGAITTNPGDLTPCDDSTPVSYTRDLCDTFVGDTPSVLVGTYPGSDSQVGQWDVTVGPNTVSYDVTAPSESTSGFTGRPGGIRVGQNLNPGLGEIIVTVPAGFDTWSINIWDLDNDNAEELSLSVAPASFTNAIQITPTTFQGSGPDQVSTFTFPGTTTSVTMTRTDNSQGNFLFENVSLNDAPLVGGVNKFQRVYTIDPSTGDIETTDVDIDGNPYTVLGDVAECVTEDTFASEIPACYQWDNLGTIELVTAYAKLDSLGVFVEWVVLSGNAPSDLTVQSALTRCDDFETESVLMCDPQWVPDLDATNIVTGINLDNANVPGDTIGNGYTVTVANPSAGVLSATDGIRMTGGAGNPQRTMDFSVQGEPNALWGIRIRRLNPASPLTFSVAPVAVSGSFYTVSNEGRTIRGTQFNNNGNCIAWFPASFTSPFGVTYSAGAGYVLLDEIVTTDAVLGREFLRVFYLEPHTNATVATIDLDLDNNSVTDHSGNEKPCGVVEDGLTQPSLESSTGQSQTTGNLQRVSIANVGVANAIVDGVNLPPGASVEYQAYLDPVLNEFRRLGPIAYDATGTELLIAETA